ncbi:MAG: binding-protein-dependent transport system inner membrane protein [Chloroflexi bacterium OLB15]|nr:MAG: binding-protein-dependent transport system inner membrane protein [Chloroflexi bacterium OLB15]
MSNKVMTYKAMKRREMLTAYAFILPTFVGFVIFIVGPMLASFAISLFDWNMLTPPRFIGLANFQQLFNDSRIGAVYLTTFKLAFMIVPTNMILGLSLAVLLDRKMPGLVRSFFKVSFFFPFVVSAVAVSIIWTFMFHRDLGPFNYYLGLLGIDRIPWLNSSTYSPFAIMIADVWRNVGFYVLVFLGGMQAIPRDFYEAAEVDGASVWKQFRHITLPLLSPTILFLTVISVIGALQIFEQPQILTNGGPGDATRTIVLYLYEQGFRFFDMATPLRLRSHCL